MRLIALCLMLVPPPQPISSESIYTTIKRWDKWATQMQNGTALPGTLTKLCNEIHAVHKALGDGK